ncbi:hypothetical protein I4U23_010942 [Adineta vaga]|nr:hypothetical protein I4U23_010942 [Adineta vaga]
MCMNIWQDQFDFIKQNSSYKVKLAKVKIFNSEVTITTITSTTFEEIKDIGDVQSSELFEIDHDTYVIGNIVSIGLLEEKLICPKCYSKEIEISDKSIKCKRCKTRSIMKKDVQENRIKLTIDTRNNELVEVITEKEKLKQLLHQSNNKHLSEEGLLENESILLVLSTINLSVTFNSKNKNLIDIQIYQIDV